MKGEISRMQLKMQVCMESRYSSVKIRLNITGTEVAQIAIVYDVTSISDCMDNTAGILNYHE